MKKLTKWVMLILGSLALGIVLHGRAVAGCEWESSNNPDDESYWSCDGGSDYADSSDGYTSHSNGGTVAPCYEWVGYWREDPSGASCGSANAQQVNVTASAGPINNPGANAINTYAQNNI